MPTVAIRVYIVPVRGTYFCFYFCTFVQVLILQNHGLAALGSTVEEAFDILINAVEACKVQVRHTAVSSGVVESSGATVVCMVQHAVVELLPNVTNQN